MNNVINDPLRALRDFPESPALALTRVWGVYGVSAKLMSETLCVSSI